MSAAGRSQGLAFEFGRGRVVVLAEMGTLIEYSVAGTNNRQFHAAEHSTVAARDGITVNGAEESLRLRQICVHCLAGSF